MCAIAGIAGPRPNQELVERMSNRLRHRGPDGKGIFRAPGICLGHRRLKILDLSDAGAQPMTSPCGRWTLVFNGEIYNYADLRNQLSGPFRSQSDTEVLLQAWMRWGPACLTKLKGMFAFALWDAQERTLHAARDPLGIKPFYYIEKDAHFAFASEPNALLESDLPRSADDGVIYDFLVHECYDHTQGTFFRGISQLPGGHILQWSQSSGLHIAPWWDFPGAVARVDLPADRPGRERALVDQAIHCIHRALASDVPLGIALSGGLDSAFLLAALDRDHPDRSRLQAFSFCFAEEAYSERPWIEAMATATGHPVSFTEIHPDQFTADISALISSQGEPFTELPILAYDACFLRARRANTIVLMDGSGLDEALAGYDRFRPAHWADLEDMGGECALRAEWDRAGINSYEAQARVRAQMQAVRAYGGDLGRGQDLTMSTRADCLHADFVATQANRLPPRWDSPFPDHLRSLQWRELRHTKLPRALRFRDRLSMRHSCELRPPFLDSEISPIVLPYPRATASMVFAPKPSSGTLLYTSCRTSFVWRPSVPCKPRNASGSAAHCAPGFSLKSIHFPPTPFRGLT